MSLDPGEEDLRQRATRRVDARRGFFAHATVYVAVNALLVLINLTTSPEYHWFVWPLFGWGIGLVIHGLMVFGLLAGDRDRAIEAEMQRLRARDRR
jgi:hypothetical protein